MPWKKNEDDETSLPTTLHHRINAKGCNDSLVGKDARSKGGILEPDPNDGSTTTQIPFAGKEMQVIVERDLDSRR